MERNNVVLLNEGNFATWKIQMKMHLIASDLFDIVDGTETAPEEDTDQYRKFCSRQKKALSALVLGVEPRLLYLLGDPEDPNKVWKKLLEHFQKKTWANKLRLRRRLYSMQLRVGKSLQNHLRDFIELFSEMAAVGDAISEEDQVICLLASLSDNYSTLVTALEASEQVPSWDIVTERLLHEENKHTSKDDTAAALVSNESESYRQHYNKKNVKCYECGRIGHIKRNCRVFLQKRKYSSDNANVACSEDADTIACTFVADTALSCFSANNRWIIDSGASQHMTNDRNCFSDFETVSAEQTVEIGDGRSLNTCGVGTVNLILSSPNSRISRCVLEKVLFVPDLSCNLFSVSKVTEKGKSVIFNAEGCKIFDDKKTFLADGTKIGKLYYLNCSVPLKNDRKNDDVALQSRIPGSVAGYNNSDTLWHKRFCHLGYDNLLKLDRKNLVTGIEVTSNEKEFCPNCCDGKNHKSPFPTFDRQDIKREPLELIHSDICGKISPSSIGGANYFLSFIDDATKYVWIYFLKSKNECFETFKNWSILVEKQFQKSIRILRSDNGGEYVSNAFELFLKRSGIRHERTIPKTPQQNAVAERMNRTLVETVRCMLSDSMLSKSFWAEALATAVYVKNRCPATSLKNVTPYEALHGLKPSVSHFKVFGCLCYSHISKDERQKLDSKSIMCVFLGYSSESKAYRVYDLNRKKTILTRDVIFNENGRINSVVNAEHYDNIVTLPVHDRAVEELGNCVSSVEDISENVQPRRSNRDRKEVDRFGDWVLITSTLAATADPVDIADALSVPDAKFWREAMNREIESIDENNVWTLCELPSYVQPIKCKWVFKRKVDSNGNLSTYKARLVAQGFTQKYGINYDETFAPVVRFESVRALLSISVDKDMKLHQMDVSCAFLNGELEEEIYICQPPGFVVEGKENLYCKLHKSLYGLKQSPRCWNKSIDTFLKHLNFVQSDNDSCIYIRDRVNNFCVIAVYVDDLIIGCKSDTTVSDIKTKLSEKFSMKDLGLLKYFLGVNILQNFDKSTIFVNQSVYARSILKKFNFDNSKPVKTPVDVSVGSSIPNSDAPMCDKGLYQSAIGCLIYLSTKTRPDIAFAVGNAARFCSSPTEFNYMCVKRIFRYLCGTVDYGILYSRKSKSNCIGFSDSDWAGDVKDRKSTSGYCFSLNGGLISWRSSKQSCVALSTAEAEYIALAGAAQEAIWLSRLLTDLNCDIELPMTINEDNQAAISIAKNPRDHPRTKHISIKYHFIRDKVCNSEIDLKYCPTADMLADIFTKGLSAEKFVGLRYRCGIVSLSECMSL